MNLLAGAEVAGVSVVVGGLGGVDGDTGADTRTHALIRYEFDRCRPFVCWAGGHTKHRNRFFTQLKKQKDFPAARIIYIVCHTDTFARLPPLHLQYPSRLRRRSSSSAKQPRNYPTRVSLPMLHESGGVNNHLQYYCTLHIINYFKTRQDLFVPAVQ